MTRWNSGTWRLFTRHFWPKGKRSWCKALASTLGALYHHPCHQQGPRPREGQKIVPPVAVVALPPLVQPQRLMPKRVYKLGAPAVPESLTWAFPRPAVVLLVYGHRGSREPPGPAFRKQCPNRKVARTTKRNLEWLAKGDLPPGWGRVADWPQGA